MITYEQLYVINLYVPEVSIKTIVENLEFSSGRLFSISRDKSELNSNDKENGYLLKFMFRKSNNTDLLSQNILGMNFLNHKVISFDHYVNKFQISDANLPSLG
jgi:hypothetical protein